MCKIIVLTDATKIKAMPEFTRKMADLLSDQPDGFGAVMQGVNGVYGVKSLYPRRFSKGLKKLKFTKSVADSYFGKESPTYGPALFHGRISTNKINITNTHPMIRDGYHLIHNGVVQNEGEDYAKDTTNDSEDILYHFINGGIDKVSQNISGYYACAVINPDNTLSIWRDDIASLHCAWSDKLESYIFATTITLITEIGKLVGEELLTDPVNDNVYLKFKGNEILEQEEFVNLGYAKISGYARSQAKHSLGYELSTPAESVQDFYDSVSEDYLEELEYLNDTYTITDPEGHLIGADEFYSMKLEEQVLCTLKRPNGMVVDPWSAEEWERDMEYPKHG